MSAPWLVVGLGNPGAQYEQTRHNAGFMAIEAMGRQWGIAGKTEKKFEALVGKGTLTLANGQGATVLLAQPLTFMNVSGKSVAALMQFYKVPANQLLVVVDDIALPVGKLRYRPEGSAGGHNGLKSIQQCLGNNPNYARLRLGVGAPPSAAQQVGHVLGKFAPEEMRVLEKVLGAALQAAECWMCNGDEATMTRFNGLDFSSPQPLS